MQKEEPVALQPCSLVPRLQLSALATPMATLWLPHGAAPHGTGAHPGLTEAGGSSQDPSPTVTKRSRSRLCGHHTGYPVPRPSSMAVVPRCRRHHHHPTASPHGILGAVSWPGVLLQPLVLPRGPGGLQEGGEDAVQSPPRPVPPGLGGAGGRCPTAPRRGDPRRLPMGLRVQPGPGAGPRRGGLLQLVLPRYPVRVGAGAVPALIGGAGEGGLVPHMRHAVGCGQGGPRPVRAAPPVLRGSAVLGEHAERG